MGEMDQANVELCMNYETNHSNRKCPIQNSAQPVFLYVAKISNILHVSQYPKSITSSNRGIDPLNPLDRKARHLFTMY